jgi:hypothetical protein
MVDEFEAAMRTWQMGAQGQTTAAAAITSALAAADAAIRRLDIVVPNQLEAHPDALSLWKSERKLTSSRRRKSAAATSTEAAPIPESPVAAEPQPAPAEKPREAA